MHVHKTLDKAVLEYALLLLFTQVSLNNHIMSIVILRYGVRAVNANKM